MQHTCNNPIHFEYLICLQVFLFIFFHVIGYVYRQHFVLPLFERSAFQFYFFFQMVLID